MSAQDEFPSITSIVCARVRACVHALGTHRCLAGSVAAGLALVTWIVIVQLSWENMGAAMRKFMLVAPSDEESAW